MTVLGRSLTCTQGDMMGSMIDQCIQNSTANPRRRAVSYCFVWEACSGCEGSSISLRSKRTAIKSPCTTSWWCKHRHARFPENTHLSRNSGIDLLSPTCSDRRRSRPNLISSGCLLQQLKDCRSVASFDSGFSGVSRKTSPAKSEERSQFESCQFH